ncbi:MAG: ABC transporter permease [Verrucomicrobiota bacterium]|nr:ABC transporter permease [Verrucomicrobiota bacterium]
MKGISLLRVVQLGIKSLLLHKMRSVLTMLGIIFGVCSVIAMLAIGEGASHEAQEAIRKLGSRNVILRSVKPPKGQGASDNKRIYTANYGLKLADIDRLAILPGVAHTLAKRIYRMQVRAGREAVPCQVVATQPHHPRLSQMQMIEGQFFNAMDSKHRRNVCVLTDSLAAKLFPISNALDGQVKIGKVVFTVIGILRETAAADSRPGAGAAEGEPLDANVYIPLTSGHARLGIKTRELFAGGYNRERVELHELTLQFTDVDQVEAAVPGIRSALDRFHDKPDYEVIVPLELLRQAERTKRIFNIVLGSIAGISLLVGGIGIMNIMLATVTERTREIGVRRALGARRRQIITQFLLETIVLAIGGGLVGVALGVGLPVVVERFAEMKTIVTLPAVLLAFGISALVGVIFGVYPARRAADLDPIEALRHT